MAKKKTVEFHISYQPHLFSFSCVALLEDFEIQSFSGFDNLSGLVERIKPICGILMCLEIDHKIIPAEDIKEIYTAYENYTSIQHDVVEPLFENMPDKRKKLVDKIWN